jgi:hypothetical protein
MIKKLIKIANNLDIEGLTKEADLLDCIIYKLSARDLRFSIDDEEFQTLDKSFFYDEKNIMKYLSEKICDELNLSTPMHLGSGAYASAFSVSGDDGSNIVLKIMPSADLKIYKSLHNNTSSYSSSILPKIYKVEDLKNLDLNFDELDADISNSIIDPFILSHGVVLMEELEPLNPALADFLTANLSSSDYKYRIFVQNSKEINEFKDELLSEINNYLEGLNIAGNIQKSIIDIIIKNINQLFNRPENLDDTGPFLSFNDKLKSMYSKYSANIIQEINKMRNLYAYKDIVFMKNEEDIIKFISKHLSFFFSRMRYYSGLLPETMDTPSSIPGQDFYLKELRKLKDMGITPYDLHNQNIMMRPETGEIVISDIGNFDFGGGSSIRFSNSF